MDLAGFDFSTLYLYDPGERGSSRMYLYLKEKFCEPITESLALIHSVQGGRARIITGFPIRPKVFENDGPLGSIVLAKSLSDLGITTELFIPLDCLETLKSVSNEVDLPAVVKPIGKSMDIDGPWNLSIFVEYPGSNYRGVRHNMAGEAISNLTFPLDHLMSCSKTLCIGDGGNEIGMGKIEDFIRQDIPFGDLCQCPCASGIASHGSCDVLLPLGTSNWACYVLAAMLGFPLDEKICSGLLQAGMKFGLVDGIKGTPSLSVDGLTPTTEKVFIKHLESLSCRFKRYQQPD
ncbi:MAG: DUF4392 domain-containing protein [Candidatus Methanomethylicus sp.]|nr:DUF4392 domain-containing protein [Candidatus Methanomethylicus sp.]